MGSQLGGQGVDPVGAGNGLHLLQRLFKGGGLPAQAAHRFIAAQAADELLNVAGVTASLVIYPMGNGDVFISARSIGELNVQLVMEALGGGGSRSSAAVQLHDVSVAQAVQMARAAIDDNLEN